MLTIQEMKKVKQKEEKENTRKDQQLMLFQEDIKRTVEHLEEIEPKENTNGS